jgi:hypothetical protein
MAHFTHLNNDTHVLFTDPAYLNDLTDMYSETGDVDDTACIILMAQTYGDSLYVVISDDINDDRFIEFNNFIGITLHQLYGCFIMMESDYLNLNVVNDMYIHIHAPITDTIAEKLCENIVRVGHVYRQGDNNSVNFKNSTGSIKFCNIASDLNKLTTFDTETTKFSIKYSHQMSNSLIPLVKQVYENFFLFQFRKNFGTALHLDFLCNRLYSDTGFNGGIGNGIKMYKQIIYTLRNLKLMPNIEDMSFALGSIEIALQNSISHGMCDKTTIVNARDMLYVMNMYCDYESLIVNNKLPNMSNLGKIIVRDNVPDIVNEFYENLKNTSTPLFDFAAGYWSIYPNEFDIGSDNLFFPVLNSIRCFSDDLYQVTN